MALQLKTVNAAHGWHWISQAVRLFARRPLAFTSLFAVFLLLALLISLIPVLGAAAQMMVLPMLSLGFMVATQSALLKGPVHPRQFIEPLQGDATKRRSLLILCLIYGLGAIAVLLLANAVSDDAWVRLQELMAKGRQAQPQVDALLEEAGVRNAVIIAAVLGCVLSIPFWHAPALVHWGSQPWGQALFSSTLAVWRNRGAFFIYALGWLAVLMGFALISSLLLSLLGVPQLASLLGIPAGLAFSAMFYMSLLFCFNDSFGSPEAAAQAHDAASG